jgi:hypothetical protein
MFQCGVLGRHSAINCGAGRINENAQKQTSIKDFNKRKTPVASEEEVLSIFSLPL